MSYLAPPSRHQPRTHTRDKVLTPFRTRASSREHRATESNETAGTQTVRDEDQEIQQQQQQQAWSEPATDRLARQQTESLTDSSNYITSQAATLPADVHHAEMNSTSPHRIPIIVDNYDTNVTKVTGSSMTSPVNAINQSRSITASSSSSSSAAAAAAAAAAAGKRLATAPKPATKTWSAAESASQHHVTASYHPTSSAVTSVQTQQLSHTSSSASIPLRPSRPFSPTTRSHEPASVADNRPWSPRMTEPGTKVISDEDQHRFNHSPSGVSSIKFVPGSQQPAAHKFTPAQRSLSPPINPTISSGVVRVPYVPTVGVVRSSSLGGNARVLPADHRQLVTSSLSSSSAAAAASVPSSVNHQVDNTVLTTSSKTVPTTSADRRPFSPTSRYISDPSAHQPPGYRRVTAPNPNSVSSNSTNDYQSSGIAQNQNKSFGPSLQPPVSLSTNSSVSTSSSNLQTVSMSGGHVIQGQQRSNVYRPFSPEISQDGENMHMFSPNNTIQQPVEATLNADQKPHVPPFYQLHPSDYQQSDTSTMSESPQARPFSPQTGQVPSTNYHPRPMYYQQSEASTMSALPGSSQVRPFSPQNSQVPPMNYQRDPVNYQQPDTSTLSGSSQARPFSPQTGQVPSMNYQPRPVNYQQSDTSTVPALPGLPQARPFSPQNSQVPTMTHQRDPMNYQQSEASTMSALPGSSQVRPFSLQNSQVPSANYQPQPVNYRQPVTSTMSGLVQTRPVTPQTRPSTPQTRPFIHQTSHLPSTNYKSPPVNYQESSTSTMSAPSPAQPFSPQSSQVPAMNYQIQSTTTTISEPSQAKPFSPHVGVKQHVQRFSNLGGSQVSNGYLPQQQQQQQHPAVRQGAPGVTSHAGYDVTAARTEDAVHAQGRHFSPRDARFVQSPTESRVQGQTRLPAAHPSSSLPSESNVNVVESLEQRPFSPSGASVTWAVTSPTHAQQYHPAASVPAARTHKADVIQRPQAAPEYELQITEPGNDKHGLPQNRPLSHSAATRSRTSAPQVNRELAENIDIRGQTRVDRQLDSTTRNLAKYQNDSRTAALVGSSSRQRTDNRPFSPPADHRVGQSVQGPVITPFSGDQRVGQPVYHPVTSTTVVPVDSSTGHRIDGRPFSPSEHQRVGQLVQGPVTSPLPGDQKVGQRVQGPVTSPFSGDQRVGQPVYHPVTSPTVVPVDSFVGHRIDGRPFNPSEDQRVGQLVHGLVTSPPSGNQEVGQPVYRAVTSPTSVSADRFVDQRIDGRPFSPSGEQSVRQPVQGPVTSPPPEDQRVGQPVYHPVTSPTVAPIDRSVGQTKDSRPFSPSSVSNINQLAADQALSPTAAPRPFSPSVSSSSLQRPSSAPSSSVSGPAAGNIQGYRRICFSPIPQSVHPGHRASPIPLMMSQQPAMSDDLPAAASKEPRISVSGARLVFTPRRGSDVTAATPPYLTSSAARSQLNVLRENQVADWKENRRPVMWIPPPPPTTARSQSLEPVSGTVDRVDVVDSVHALLSFSIIPRIENSKILYNWLKNYDVT